jgi:hypothetical protein
MRTTLRIDNNLLQELKELAHEENTTMTQMVNRVLRRGLQSIQENCQPRTHYHEEVIDLGKPYFDLTKASAIATNMEDEEILRKLELRK